ncbi:MULTISPECIES: TetR/AcrR family transcriptional regulator [unclassified Streptomyces]|uniref:TetR/AcrR family transcriptional regulator n=1 Tax=unclassified Streptomyces TaxID=2593676 RepID=UPI000B81D94A|nr:MULTISPECIES: TetR/AcrR family transcriptional regulator [unclassified Streptomyces]MYS20150.1 TetR family transcriptional regulator [Streptomyces sp. SID4948]
MSGEAGETAVDPTTRRHEHRRPQPRERLLETASALFYAEGIRSIGVDRLIAEAQVTKATFYRHFPTKDDLVVAYLRGRDEAIRSRLADAAAGVADDPRKTLGLLLDGLADEVCGPGFRGCPFINAAAEYPDAAHPVRALIDGHRGWFRAALLELAAGCGHPDPEVAAAALFLLRDGAMVGGYLDGAGARRSLAQAAGAVVGGVL